MNDNCPICSSPLNSPTRISGDRHEIDCPQCGEFTVSGTARVQLQYNPLSKTQIANASGWIRENQGTKILTNDIETLKNLKTLTITEKADKLLLYLARSFPTPGHLITPWEKELSHPSIFAITRTQNYDELSFLFYDYLLTEKGFLIEQTSGIYRISPKGWIYIGRLNQNNSTEKADTNVEMNQSNEKEQIKDVFLCHCSEDKKDYVEPLVSRLSEEGITYWYDKAEIKWGDPLLSKIHEGLKISEYVIVFLSKSFIKKGWPKHELENAMTKEIKEQKTVVLPLLIGDENEIKEILSEFGFIQTKKYLKFSGGIENIITELKNVLKKNNKASETPPRGRATGHLGSEEA